MIDKWANIAMFESPLCPFDVVLSVVVNLQDAEDTTYLSGPHCLKIKYSSGPVVASCDCPGGEAFDMTDLSAMPFGAGCKMVNAASGNVPGAFGPFADMYATCAMGWSCRCGDRNLLSFDLAYTEWETRLHPELLQRIDSLYWSTSYGCVIRYVCKFDREARLSYDIRLSLSTQIKWMDLVGTLCTRDFLLICPFWVPYLELRSIVYGTFLLVAW